MVLITSLVTKFRHTEFKEIENYGLKLVFQQDSKSNIHAAFTIKKDM